MGRGAPIDGIFFLAVAGILIFGELGWLSLGRITVPKTSVLLVGACILGVLMVLAPRHGIIEGIIVSAIGLTVLLLSWQNHQSRSSEARAIKSAKILWAVVALMVCVIEVTSFLMGLPSADAMFAHPSISLLLDPMLDTPEGRIVFTALWLAIGIGLLKRGQR